MSDIKKKCDLFTLYFAEQCTPLVNNSKLPSVLTVPTKSLLELFYFFVDHIGDVKKLDPNKAHGHNMISIRMLKLCGDSTWKPLEIIFKNFLKKGIFPDEWKKPMLYRPASLLSVCSKIIGCLIYNSMYKHISDNNLFSPNQSGFGMGDSCTN